MRESEHIYIYLKQFSELNWLSVIARWAGSWLEGSG